jgi:hypothetical protein
MKFVDVNKLYPEEFATCYLCHEECTTKYRKPGTFIDMPQPSPITDYYAGIKRNPNEYLPRGETLVKDYCETCVKKYYPEWKNNETML